MLLKYPSTFNTDTLKTIIVSNATKDYEQYKIKPFDVITVRNLQDPALLGAKNTESGNLNYNYSYKVSSEGDIILPVLGTLHLAGLTRESAKQQIQKLYSEKLFNDPIIELYVNSLKVTLLGEFNVQGNVILDNEKFDLIDIIGKANGLTDNADIKHMRIIRGDRKNPELILINLNNINTLSNPKLTLQDGDIILAEKKSFTQFIRGVQTFSVFSSIAVIILNSYVLLKTIK